MLTAGLSPSAGEHAGKWVTVSTVCLPHICFTSTLSALRKRSTSRQRTKTASKCGNSLRQSLCAEWRCSKMTHDATSPLSCFPMRGFTDAEWKHFWWSVAGRMMVPRQSQYSGDEVRLSNSVGSNQGNFQDEKKKKNSWGSMCVFSAGRSGLPTWLRRKRAALKVTVWSCLSTTVRCGKSMVISKPGNILESSWLRCCYNGVWPCALSK